LKAREIFEITAKGPPGSGVLAQMYASLAIKLGHFVNVSADLSLLKILQDVTGKETKVE
jgi:hypothetical protein